VNSLTGTLEYIELEGGFWGIIGDDGLKYSMVNDPPLEFQKVGKRVFIQYRNFTGFSIRMWGRMIDVLNYEDID